jgi:O-antigen ligase
MNARTQVPAAYYSWGIESWPMEGEVDRLVAWYHSMALALVGLAIFANLPIYGYVLQPALLPKFAYVAAFLLLLPLLVVKNRSLSTYLLSPFALWTGLFLVLNLVHLAAFPEGGQVAGTWLADTGMEARRDAITIRIQYAVFALVLGFAVHTAASASWLRALVLLALAVPCAVLVDFLQPGLLYPLETGGAVLGRAAAMYINPTMAGEAILLVFLLACAVTPARWRGPLFVLAGVSVLTTFSRSAILGWLLVGAVLVLCKTLPRSATAMTVLAVCAVVAGAGAFENYLLSRSEFDAAAGNILARLDFFSTLSLGDDSAGERAEVLAAGWEMFLQNPVFGAGAGATQFWSHRGSTHNQLLLLAAEYGIFGVGMWVWMVVIVLRGRFFDDPGLQVAMAFLFVFMSMFTHQMFDSATYWFAAFACASAGRTPRQTRKTLTAASASWREFQPAGGYVPLAWSYTSPATQGQEERVSG